MEIIKILERTFKKSIRKNGWKEIIIDVTLCEYVSVNDKGSLKHHTEYQILVTFKSLTISMSVAGDPSNF